MADSIGTFLHMGGYALYVWGSFVVTAVVLGGELWLLRRQGRAAQTHYRRLRELDADDMNSNRNPHRNQT